MSAINSKFRYAFLAKITKGNYSVCKSRKYTPTNIKTNVGSLVILKCPVMTVIILKVSVECAQSVADQISRMSAPNFQKI